MNMGEDARSYQPEIILLYCQHCVLDDAQVDVICEKASGFSVRPVLLLCSSQVEVSQILKMLEEGTDGIEMVACPAEECRLLVGSRRANLRIEYLQNLLLEIDMDKERVGISRGSGLSAPGLFVLAERRAAAVRVLGPHPSSRSSARMESKD
jgi:coenzyme F420-reducing hydrogenase delta subunit